MVFSQLFIRSNVFLFKSSVGFSHYQLHKLAANLCRFQDLFSKHLSGSCAPSTAWRLHSPPGLTSSGNLSDRTSPAFTSTSLEGSVLWALPLQFSFREGILSTVDSLVYNERSLCCLLPLSLIGRHCRFRAL